MEPITITGLILNAGGRTRRMTVGSNAFLVVPVTMIVPGVLPGSHGPLYYPPEEIIRNAHDWNGMPVVVNHPLSPDGLAVSARDPEVLQASGIGSIYRAQATVEDPVLKAEAWINVNDANRVDPRVIADIEAGRNVEVSTGLGLDEEVVPEGTVHNAVTGPVPYRAVARNYRPDHLAVLLDSKGACTVDDGCGLRLNQTTISHDELRDRLTQALTNRHSPPQNSLQPGDQREVPYDDHCFLVDVFDKDVVYAHKGKFWKLPYATDMRKGSVTLSEREPAEVRRVVSYKEVNNTSGEVVGNEAHFEWELVKTVEEGDMDRKKHIEYIVANCDCWNKPDDKKVLEAMNDDQLGRVHASVKKSKEAPAVNTSVPVAVPVNTPVPAPAPVQVPVVNAQQPVVLTQEMLNSLVAQITTGVITNVRVEGEKAHLVSSLLANAAEEHRQSLSVTYNSMSVEQLRPLAAALPPLPQWIPGTMLPGAVNFGPAAGVAPVVNATVDQEDTLPDPDYSFLDTPRARGNVRNGQTASAAD